MKYSTSAFAPANISCIFKIHEDPSSAKTGSTGLGFTLDKGVTVEVSSSDKLEIFFNKKKIDFPTVEYIVKQLTQKPLHVAIISELPLSSGFGLSGASALATAYATNELLALSKTNLELAKLAHVAEVENMTGLGDVVNQYFGGFLLKTVPSSEFTVHRISLNDIPVYCRYFGELSTKSVLSNPEMKKRINAAATEALEKVQRLFLDQKVLDSARTIQFSDLMNISKEFAQKSGLLKDKEVIHTIQDIESQSGHASMIMLGNAVMSDIDFEGATKYAISTIHAHML